MFSKIPQRFTAPFGLLGDEAKLAFPSQPGGIAKLAAVRNIPQSDNYWDQYFVLFDSASDVFSLITPHHIRRALIDAPENVATLIRVVTSRLFNLISDHTFPSTSNSSVTAFATSFMKTAGASGERNTTKEVLNCLRILQRVLPVIFEVEGESNIFEAEVLWKKQEAEEEAATVDVGGSETPQFVIEDDEDSDEERAPQPPQSSPGNPKERKQLPSLGERLFSSIIDLMFCCGFTLPTKIQVDHYKINYVIWEKGIGSTTDPGPSHAYDNNKTEVLRLLLILLSRQIYVPPGLLFLHPSLYTLHLVQETTRRDILTVLCSLLNTAMNSAIPADNSLGSMAGKLPYNHLVFKGEDPRSNLVGTCFQVLCVLLDFQSGSARDIATGSGEAQVFAPTPHTNSFRYFLMKLHRVQDFEFIVGGTLGVLEQQMAATNNLLPGARKAIPYISETIIFFWKMIELNKKFRFYVLESDKAMDLVAHLLCYCLEIKDKPQQHGLCRALSYIIQTLSAETAFGVKLSTPIRIQLPTKWVTSGTAADFMINAIYSIVATTSGALNSLYPALIIALSNSAPYFKNLTVTASTRLVQLFNSFSNPLFLLADEGHPRLLFFMLEVFNSVILHHLPENPNLIYGILTAHKIFEDLGTFTLSRGLREIKRVQAAKEEQAQKNNSNPKRRVSGDVDEDAQPGDEKARLLESDHEQTLAVHEPEQISEHEDTTAQPHASPTSENTPISESTQLPASEKARGKMKAKRSLSSETTASLDHIAAAGVGRNGFVPTQEWVCSLIFELCPDTEGLIRLLRGSKELQASRHKANSTTAIVDFLSSATLKHVLPPAPPLTPRRFIFELSVTVVGRVDRLVDIVDMGRNLRPGMSPLGIWNGTNVRLFYVKHAQHQQRQITEAVSNVVGGFLRRTSDSPQIRQRS
ncbi:high-temperature-induced dauer-formation protein-domain-containing protein [Infundibulicybe gibba]|nr:high-temperature-induced dauer-formation protein-domain-containing protein [Infundibulicybe gibba]